MTTINGKKILKLFDYFKTAFSLNMRNKQLYRPQILYLILRGILIFLSGLTIINLTTTMAPFIGSVDFTTFLRLFSSEFLGTPLLILSLSLLVLLFGSTYVEAGLYKMYGDITYDDTSSTSFTSGANRYFLSFLGGNILIGLFWLLAIVPYFLIGFLTLTLGLIWIPIIISALLMVWKAAIIVDDSSVFTAIGTSIGFGRRHFIPANVFILLKTALTDMGGSGGSSNAGNNFTNNTSDFEQMPFDSPDLGNGFFDTTPIMEGFDFASLIEGIFIAITGFVSLASVLVGLIHMIFEIFFGLTTVIIYRDDWYISPEEPNENKQELDADIKEMEVE